MMKKISGLVSLLSLTACATMAVGSHETITVSTTSPTPTTCILTNTRESQTITAPITTLFKRSMSDLHATCIDPSGAVLGESVIPSDYTSSDIGNIFTLGLGMLVDWTTGAAYSYPQNIVVQLADPVTPYMTLPAMPGVPLVMPDNSITATPLPTGDVPVVPATVVTPAPSH